MMRKLFAGAAVAAFAASAFIAPTAGAASPPSSSHLSQTRPTAPNWRSGSGDEYDSYNECTLDAFTDPDVGGLSGVDCYQLDNGQWTY
ncbi:hypothetical protein [Streptomyces mirabilis]|uniref:hypothetical protein n=1 Tax=Streptomyces mirabilis TaxID=68239 RepID=UPI0036D993C5